MTSRRWRGGTQIYSLCPLVTTVGPPQGLCSPRTCGPLQVLFPISSRGKSPLASPKPYQWSVAVPGFDGRDRHSRRYMVGHLLLQGAGSRNCSGQLGKPQSTVQAVRNRRLSRRTGPREGQARNFWAGTDPAVHRWNFFFQENPTV